MTELTIDAYGKINLSLDVLKRREDGYHELRMVMQQIDLKDTITINHKDEGIVLESNHPLVPLGPSNLAYKAWQVLSETFGIDKGINIRIEKRIPIAAGLAGGSSDAAAVLKGLNKLWKLHLKEEILMDLGLKIGADVPYCLMGGTALAEGIGEKLTKLKSFSNRLIVLAKPDISVSTADVYKNLDLSKPLEHPRIYRQLRYLEEGCTDLVSKEMINVLETVTINQYPEIQDIKNRMLGYGALGSMMSGSGPTVFGIFEDRSQAEACRKHLNSRMKDVYITKTL